MKRFIDRWEIPTWAVIIAIHSGWLAATYFHDDIPTALLIGLGGILVCWHMHLQHEILHGHPTRIRRFNEIFASLPAALWLPYAIYRDDHLQHHNAELTSPDSDPESFYVSQACWQRLPWPAQQLLIFNNTVVGRLLIGPLLAVPRFWFQEIRSLLRRDVSHLRTWLAHGFSVGLVCWWLIAICDMSVGFYILAFAWPGTSLALLRSFLEHRPAAVEAERTAIVEDTPFFGLLFLNNNLHVVHHDHPGIPWYRITAFYRANREDIITKNGGYCFKGYGEVMRRFLLTPKDIPIYPGTAMASSPFDIPAAPQPLLCEGK